MPLPLTIAPSILAADFGNLAAEIKAVDKAGADWIHLDVMDGVFVPNITFGPPVVQAVRCASKKCFDAHLMVANPESYIIPFIDAGAEIVSVHLEACKDITTSLKLIRVGGAKAGLAINPATDPAPVADLLDLVDLILVMTVHPGFGGQAFMAEVIPKIAAVRDMVGSRDIDIEVDGGITAKTAPLVAAAGANVLVAGSSVFGKGGDGIDTAAYAANIKSLRDAAARAA